MPASRVTRLHWVSEPRGPTDGQVCVYKYLMITEDELERKI